MIVLGTFNALRFLYGTPFEQFIYMTTWGAYFCFFSLLLNFIATEDQKKNPGAVTGWKFWIWRNAIWLFEMTLGFDVMITIMYWGFERKYSPTRDFDFDYYYNFFIHIFPLVFNLIDFLSSNWWFRLQHLITPFIVGITYGIFNYIYVDITGKPVYDILPWDPVWKSLLLIVFIAVLVSSTFYIFLRYTVIFNGNQEPSSAARDLDLKTQTRYVSLNAAYK